MKKKVNPYPDPKSPGRRRGQVWGPVCRALRGCIDSQATVLPATARFQSCAFAVKPASMKNKRQPTPQPRPPRTTPRADLGTSLLRSTRLCRIPPADRQATARSWTRVPAWNPKNRVWVISRSRPPRTTPRADLGTSLPRSTRLRRILPADRPAAARSWPRFLAWNP